MDRFEFLKPKWSCLNAVNHPGKVPKSIGAREEAFVGFWSILRSLVQENLPKTKWIM